MSTVRTGCLAAAVLLLAAATSDRAAAVVCVADCNDDGAVLINELVAAVNIAPLAQSPTTITGTYDVAVEPACGLADCRIVISGRMRRIR